MLEEEERRIDEYSSEFGTQLIESMVFPHEQHET